VVNPIGLSTGALFPDYLTEDALAVASQFGFDTVEIYLQTPGEYHSAFVRKVKQSLNHTGLTAHSLHNDTRHFDLWSPYSRRAAEGRDLFKRLIEIAVELGAQALTWHGLAAKIDDEDAIARFVESAYDLGEQAQQAGVILTVENVSWCYLRRVDHVQHLRDLPIGFTFDPFQAAESGENSVELIHSMGDRLTTVHLSDYGTGVIRHLPVGQGNLDWAGLFWALSEIHYTGPLIIESPYRGDLQVLADGRGFVLSHLVSGA
jgi:deoxyribonuclease-4